MQIFVMEARGAWSASASLRHSRRSNKAAAFPDRWEYDGG